MKSAAGKILCIRFSLVVRVTNDEPSCSASEEEGELGVFCRSEEEGELGFSARARRKKSTQVFCVWGGGGVLGVGSAF